MSEQYVLVSEMANEFGMDKSNMRKYVLKHGFSLVQMRTPESRNQLVLALTADDADSVRELRRNQGYIAATPVVDNGCGWFYIVQIVPDLDPLRVKMGFATDSERRLDTYRTLSPTATMVKAWLCKASWERAAIDSLTRVECRSIGGEVFSCEDVHRLVERGDSFFSLLPLCNRNG